MIIDRRRTVSQHLIACPCSETRAEGRNGKPHLRNLSDPMIALVSYVQVARTKCHTTRLTELGRGYRAVGEAPNARARRWSPYGCDD